MMPELGAEVGGIGHLQKTTTGHSVAIADYHLKKRIVDENRLIVEQQSEIEVQAARRLDCPLLGQPSFMQEERTSIRTELLLFAVLMSGCGPWSARLITRKKCHTPQGYQNGSRFNHGVYLLRATRRINRETWPVATLVTLEVSYKKFAGTLASPNGLPIIKTYRLLATSTSGATFWEQR